MRQKIENWLTKYVVGLIYVQVWAAVIGSLFFSQVMKLPPCVLCLVQRGLIYPLVLIIGVGLWRKDRNWIWYALPFSILGTVVAAYHNLIYWHIIPETLTPCSVQLPCTVKDFDLFGFVTIPLMSLVAFLVVSVGIMAYLKLVVRRTVD